MIAVSGASGYIGALALSAFQVRGEKTLALTQHPERFGPTARLFSLNEPLQRGVLDGVDTVVHAAFDFKVRPSAYLERNAIGSVALVEATHQAGVRFILISSMSSFDGCRSNYGRAKRALELLVLERGGIVIRPGLVFGQHHGGLFGRLVDTIGRQRVVPLPGLGRQPLFVTHDIALCRLLVLFATHGGPSAPVFAAHEVATCPAGLVAHIAGVLGRSVVGIPVPWQIPYVLLRAAETSRMRLPFTGDNLLGIAQGMPSDVVAQLLRTEISFPPLDGSLWTPRLEPLRPSR